jgi:Mrp family chromosome partitioning ATPase
MHTERTGSRRVASLQSLEPAIRDESAGRRQQRALELAPPTRGVLALQAAFTELYHALEVRRTATVPLVVQFMAPSAQAGSTTVACGYARVAAAQSSDRVLLIDGSGAAPHWQRSSAMPTLFDAVRRNLPLSEAIRPVRDCPNLSLARLSPTPHALLAFGSAGLTRLLGVLRSEHAIVVIDSPPADRAGAAALSRFCDGTVLVVTAGRTREREIAAARSVIERLGGQAVGLVLNRQHALLPRWLDRRL